MKGPFVHKYQYEKIATFPYIVARLFGDDKKSSDVRGVHSSDER